MAGDPVVGAMGGGGGGGGGKAVEAADVPSPETAVASSPPSRGVAVPSVKEEFDSKISKRSKEFVGKGSPLSLSLSLSASASSFSSSKDVAMACGLDATVVQATIGTSKITHNKEDRDCSLLSFLLACLLVLSVPSLWILCGFL